MILDGDQALIEEPIDYLGLNVYSRVVVNAKTHDGCVWAASEPHPVATTLTTVSSTTRARYSRRSRWCETTTGGPARSTSPRTG